ncbi:MAG: 30S ribosomal protein S6, partial [Spirochaetes bacterium]|nr:30S ribosomal protein S6 [Spirochaetota bacterium]
HGRVELRTYEYLYIFDPQEENVAKTIEEIKKDYEKLGVRLIKEEEMGKRRLAYEIDKKTDGFYYLTQIEVDDFTKMQEFEKDLTLNPIVIRFMKVKM